MMPLKQTAFRIEPALLEQLSEIKRRDGVPISEQVRRALAAWVESRKTARKQAGRRKRS
jgi:Ribbon-helix-helix protein, copG family